MKRNTISEREFYKRYKKTGTIAEAKELIQVLTTEQREELIEALEITKDYMGITMRDDLILQLLRNGGQ